MKLLFLDFDGVLNSTQSTKMHWRNGGRQCLFVNEDHFCPLALSNLQFIMEQVPDLSIVISSSWRLMHPLEELQGFLLSKAGIDPSKVLGITPDLPHDPETGRSADRGLEVQAWLDENASVPEGSPLLPRFAVQDFIIVDDDSDMAHLKTTNFLQTDHDLGLTIKDARTIIARFKGDADGW